MKIGKIPAWIIGIAIGLSLLIGSFLLGARFHRIPPLQGLVASGAPDLTSSEEEIKLSYVIGYDIGERVKDVPGKLSMMDLYAGIEDRVRGGTTRFSRDSILKLQQHFQERFEKHEDSIQAYRQRTLDFLSNNKHSQGIKELGNGLQYQIIKEGNAGPRPSLSSKVVCNLIGSVFEGAQIENTYSEGHPRAFNLKDAIQGIKEIIPLQNVGSKWKVWIPSPLAYGRKAKGKAIREYALLIYEIELIGFE